MIVAPGKKNQSAWVWVAVAVIVLTAMGVAFAYHHYQGIAASNERLVEFRETRTPSELQERSLLQEVWENRFSEIGFCQSTVSTVSPLATEAFRQSLDEDETTYWRSSPTDGYFADCFEDEDWSKLQSLLSSKGAIVAPAGGGADHDGNARWVTHFRLFDPESGRLYQATQTGVIIG